VPHIDPLLDRNREFAARNGQEGVSIMPRHPVFVVTCLDPRTDPAAFLGVELGDSMVVRNAGGRVTPDVLRDIAFIGALAELQVSTGGPLFEVAVIHHSQCGTAFLAAEPFRQSFASRTGFDEAELAAQAVTDPEHTVLLDVERVRSSTTISARVTVSGHVYDVETGGVRTIVAASPMHYADERMVV
jgi:carbonic anhydrase